ncbi:MAG TPA: DUF5682 family protein [Mycobacteriales bacterium]|nr:DUF5682 family protein [Mycobacteriales bacterium]
MTVRVFGIRHHGPGSARSLRAELESWQPDTVLVEGPPEGDALIPLAADEAMQPPVALLVYAPAEPGRAVFYPFAAFSPEWVAIRHALAAGVPVRFVDLPVAASLGEERDRRDHHDPIAMLADAAGYDDAERWWEDMVEHRQDGAGPFAAIAEAMTAIREGLPPPSGREARREAAMRQGIRTATRAGHDRVAVVCGAWHVPALLTMPTASSDATLLHGLPKTKVAATWIPWTHRRLSFVSGYGAGVTSPGWYHHLFTAPDQVVGRWLTRVAHLLRGEDLDASSASVIEAVRLAETLATMRGRPLAGLDEVMDATRAVLTRGSDVPTALVWDRLVVGEQLGAVPDHTPMVPLQQDLSREQRRLRLKPEASVRDIDLDLRKPYDLDKSHLLHRLEVLGVHWGKPEEAAGKSGTFHELWRLQWEPELSVSLIEAGMWGTTVATAADTAARERADRTDDLGRLTALAEQCLLAALPDAVGHVMRVFADRAAVDTDVAHLMDALTPLARVLRYGNVRRTDAQLVAGVVDGLVARICIGLPVACASLDDAAAAAMVRRIAGAHSALGLLDRPDLRGQWTAALHHLLGISSLHGMVAGRSCRLLLDLGVVPSDEAATRLSAALSLGEHPAHAAAWVEGFLSGSGLLLLHDERLLTIVDRWLGGVGDEVFDDLLPLLRRTFSTFTPPERRSIGERVRHLDAVTGAAARRRQAAADDDVDHDRGAAVLPLVSRLLGLAPAGGGARGE